MSKTKDFIKAFFDKKHPMIFQLRVHHGIIIDEVSLLMQEYASQQTSELKAENERLRGLVEHAYSEGYEDGDHHENFKKSWEGFCQENKI